MDADLKETEKNLENLNSQKRQLALDNDQLQKDLEDVSGNLLSKSKPVTESFLNGGSLPGLVTLHCKLTTT